MNSSDSIQLIMRQTNYTEDEAYRQLQLCDNNPIKVIKLYLGITEKKDPPVKSINQEIYKQLRHKLDTSMKEYNSKQEAKIMDEISNNNTTTD